MRWPNSWMTMSDGFFRHNSADQDKKLDAEVLEVGGVSVHRQRVEIGDKTQQALILDDTGTGVMYIGTASPGALENQNVWRIKQILTSGANVRILWAEGNSGFVHRWDMRAGLSYT